MPTLKERILAALGTDPGLTDRELTDRLFDRVTGPQAINQAARSMVEAGRIVRRNRADGQLGNYLATFPSVASRVPPVAPNKVLDELAISEDQVKQHLKTWLEASGWHVPVQWGRDRGIDIDAKNGQERWIIEVKGCGSLQPMRVNYFLSILGELLQRMEDDQARYSIALPDIKQYRGLWQRLPALAKRRATISALFVSASGRVEEA